jgi:eukaryotic-like serine/threonine-protein kinase
MDLRSCFSTVCVSYVNLRLAEAAVEFQRILDHRGIAGDFPPYSLVHLGLARAYTIASEKEKSHKAYENFFALCRHADPDIPILQQPKAEFAKLQ